MPINRHALTALRTKDGQTMTALAGKAQIALSTLNDIEKGRRGAGPETIKRLALALNVPVSALEAVSDVVTDGVAV
jgi:transcriptional regulator with XRE-family HTH domain